MTRVIASAGEAIQSRKDRVWIAAPLSAARNDGVVLFPGRTEKFLTATNATNATVFDVSSDSWRSSRPWR